MKNKLLILLLTLTIFVNFGGCASTKLRYLNPEAFMEMADREPTSIHSYTYIGASRRKIYIEFETVLTSMAVIGISRKHAYTIYWTDVEKISKEFVDNMENQKQMHMQRLGNL